jgi:copper chaperone NosL
MIRFIFLATVSILLGCNPTVEPINFGEEECSFCKMAIVDQRYGAEILSKTGKVFKYDAIECMVNALCENTNNEVANFHSAYVIDFTEPGKLVDASTSYYLYSMKLPSPMGAYLTSFSTKMGADNARSEYTGDVLNWKDLVLKVRVEKTCLYDL